MLACLIGLAGFEPATSPTRTERATKLRHSPCGRPSVAARLRRRLVRSGGDSLVVADREAGQEGLEALLDGHAVLLGVTAQAVALDRLALLDHLVDKLRMLVAEERPHRVEVRVHQRGHELLVGLLPAAPLRALRRLCHGRAGYPRLALQLA